MRILMLGDITSRPGRRAISERLQDIIKTNEIDFVIANGENAAGGNGITREIADELFLAGIDVLTMGNHVWDKKEIYNFIDKEARILRPANYPPGTPGTGWGIFRLKNNLKIGVVSLAGRVFMGEQLDCPFRTLENVISSLTKETKIIIIDFHAEATSEKQALAWYFDGRVSAICGTHTHVLTCDARIFPRGTAYITDLGMTGPYYSVLGVKPEIVIRKFITQLPQKFEVASGPWQINGAILEIDEGTGNALAITTLNEIEKML
ncbi:MULTISPECIES: TIGR00282 family metallophosphoesterase [Carboxydocella]|uniref:TIGR00282 family metallophosphoesterase n=2 Tax=Carboxydocella TaxID=178898 RepID=A0A1T4LPS7_9FIRM|nr:MULTISPECIES: TIGR00282 family metallophosphoesterase [Carboxydocella]AVX20555.1 hypothetical protein CFE_1366 [Carboxydocella thermautotrophica]AVX30977.1 hypothetical protein CTH_1387 [Carboxydocella thermautotrophica]SJZ56732.1 hypothetical protein SAMN02745885_00245 [Carboxydocella sporoproducens DSM 16521]GAW29627.1 metallophosphoesterase [Carboxydocella sp. ULO1]GAW31482.1 metallophosphoesterase [Carboxydocella sp. JDF658]